jgi:hypothetical protein
MFQIINDTVQEVQTTLTTTGTYTNGLGQTGYWPETTGVIYSPYYYYGNYPVYVCTDKTKKAIDILKHLQAKKKIRCDDVDKFIALVEEIAGLL